MTRSAFVNASCQAFTRRRGFLAVLVVGIAMLASAASANAATQWSQISADGYHSCGITAAGAAKCWGSNYSGQLGNDSTARAYKPVQVVGLTSGVTAIAVSGGPYSGSWACAIQSGAVKCWGDNYGKVPMSIAGATSGATAIATTQGISCAVVSGNVKCWGGSYEEGDEDPYVPGPAVTVGGTAGAIDVAIAAEWDNWYPRICAVISGAAMCWDPPGNPSLSTTPVTITGLASGVTAISGSNAHFCVAVSGAAKCFGENGSGQLGDGSVIDSELPVQVSGLTTGVTDVAGGRYHSCALVSGGVQCWGNNGTGDLGNGTQVNSNVPVPVTGLGIGVTSISAGVYNGCAVQNQVGKCWGWNNAGQLGGGRGADSHVPSQAIGLETGVTDVAMGGATGDNELSAFSCAIHGGAAKCWGGNSDGQLGVGTVTDGGGYEDTPSKGFPTQVIGLTSGVTDISTGGRMGGWAYNSGHSCAVVSGAARCWGINDQGQVGDGTTTMAPAPVQVTGLTANVTAVAAGNTESCAIVSGAVQCWGGSYPHAPTAVSGLASGVTDITAGAGFFCAVISGAVKCWGSSAAIGASPAPTTVSGLTSGATAVSGGYEHACAVVSGGIRCWGSNQDGELGNGTTIGSTTPVQVTGIASGATAVAAGGTDYEYGPSQSCAIVSGGVRCWGGNSSGQLGNNTIVNSSIPVQVNGLNSGATAVAAGYSASCAVVSAALRCWGGGNEDQLADGFKIATTALTVAEPAVLTITTPAPDQVITTAVSQLKFDIREITVASTECKVDAAAYAACASPYTTPNLSDGNHTFWVRVTDSSANVYEESSKFRVDTADHDGPVVTVTSPLNNQTIGTTSLSVAFTVADASPTTIQCSLDNAPLQACTSPWQLSNLSNGNHYILVKATDTNNNVTYEYVDFTVLVLDMTPPVISNVSPASGTTTTEPSIVVSYQATDNSGQTPSCTPWPSSGANVELQLGANTITIRCRDSANNLAIAVITVTRAAVAPSPPQAPPAPPQAPPAPPQAPPASPQAPPASRPALLSTTKSIATSGRASFNVDCATACTVITVLKIGKKKYPVPSAVVPAGSSTASVKIPKPLQKKIAAAAKKAKKSKKSLKVSLLVKLTSAGGTSSAVTVPVRVKVK